MKTTISILMLLIISNISVAQNTIIPDPNFEQALINLGYDTGIPDGIVPTSNINTVTFLTINNKSISNLTGIESFTSLTFLYCANNLLTSLDVSQNTLLKNLDCFNNQLSSLICSGATTLEYLNCNVNVLYSLDLSQNNMLKNLYCRGNQLTSLDLSNNTILSQLYCSSNQLTNLNLSNNTALSIVECTNNQLTSLDVTQNTALINFYCDHNLLSSLLLNGASSLDYLDCTYNLLTTIDFTQTPQLRFLYCYRNQLTSLNVSQNSILYLLNCSDNQLSSLDVTQNSELYEIFCDHNLLTSLSLSINNKASVDCSNNLLTNLFVSNINTLYCDSNQLSCIKINSDTLSYLSTQGNTNLFCIENNFISPNTILKDSWTSLSNNCSNACSSLGVNENILSNVSIYPNPSYNTINIDLREVNISKIEIYTITGQKIDMPLHKKSDETIEIDIRSLVDGVYILKIVNTVNSTEMVKFIKSS